MITSYYDFGYNTFGPFLYGYTKWLREKIKGSADKKVFFFSRDGYIMQKAYVLFEKADPLGLEHHYVYFSRNSLRKGLLWKCKDYEETLTLLSNDRYTEIAKIASLYGLEQKEISPLLKQLNIGWNSSLFQKNLSKNVTVRTIFDCFEKTIRERSQEHYETTIKYLYQIGLHGDCAMVDIGWNGTMQYYLDCLLKIGGIKANLNAYYVGITSRMPHNGKAEGYIFNNSDDTYRKSILCFLGGIEKLFQSFEGSTDRYVCMDDQIIPILKPYEYEKDDGIKESIKNLQMGALDYVKKGVESNYTFKNYTDAFSRLLYFGKYPDYEDTKLFKFFYVADGGKQFFLPQKSIFRYRPKEFVLALSNSIWKTGFMKAAFRIPFPYYWIYKLMSK